MVLSLKKDILYGPVNSRRYGRSLGINLLPITYKLCSFNCVYCHYGLTDKCTTEIGPYLNDLPKVDDVIKELESAARSDLQFDLMTFSGNGEPTLYPEFAKLVDEVIELRDRYRPEAKIALLSNSTGLADPAVREAVEKIDLPVLKLDAGTELKFKSINRPARGIEYDDVLADMAATHGIYIQSVMVDGKPSNTSAEDLAGYFERLTQIQPIEVHIYSIDRPVPNERLALVPPQRLAEIASEISSETGIPARAFFGSKQ